MYQLPCERAGVVNGVVTKKISSNASHALPSVVPGVVGCVVSDHLSKIFSNTSFQIMVVDMTSDVFQLPVRPMGRTGRTFQP